MNLPDDLALPLASGEPWWYWLGGRPALDFVNTRRERWWRRVETLVTPADLSRWIVRAGVLGEAPEVSPSTLAAAHDLREAIDETLVAGEERRPPSPQALGLIESWLSRAHVPDRLMTGPDGRPVLGPGVPADPARHALGLIARDAAEMLATDQRDRVRICASETCSARFYDRSRSGRRRWCSMQACGNAAKARRHRARMAPSGAVG